MKKLFILLFAIILFSCEKQVQEQPTDVHCKICTTTTTQIGEPYSSETAIVTVQTFIVCDEELNTIIEGKTSNSKSSITRKTICRYII